MQRLIDAEESNISTQLIFAETVVKVAIPASRVGLAAVIALDNTDLVLASITVTVKQQVKQRLFEEDSLEKTV